MFNEVELGYWKYNETMHAKLKRTSNKRTEKSVYHAKFSSKTPRNHIALARSKLHAATGVCTVNVL